MTTAANIAKVIASLRGDCAGVRFDMDAYDPPNAGGVETVAFTLFQAGRFTKLGAMRWTALKLGLDNEHADELFFADALDCETFRKITPQQAARCLERVMKTGKVNWPAAVVEPNKTRERKARRDKGKRMEAKRKLARAA